MSAVDMLRRLGRLFTLSLMTRRLAASFFMIMASAALGIVAAAAQTTTPALSLQQVMNRGKAMYLYDRAAWLTYDDLIARLSAERQPEIGGWIVTPSAQGVHVDYFGKDTNAEHVVYAADVNGDAIRSAIVYPATAEPLLKEPALGMSRALRAARIEMDRHSDWKPCTKAGFNTIVLPPDQSGIIPIYFLTPQTEFNSFPFGGHYEVDISKDGRVTNARAFARSCVTITKPGLGSGPIPTALFITHLLDTHPTEIHVFEQYYIGIPVLVGTGPKTVWKVEEGQIEDVSSLMAK